MFLKYFTSKDSLVNYEDTLHVDKDYSFADLLLKDDTSPAVRGSLIEISSGGEIPFCQTPPKKDSLLSKQKNQNPGSEQIFVCSPNKGVIVKHIAWCSTRRESLSPRKIIPPF